MYEMNDEERKSLGNKIKQLRKQKGLSQQQLADMIGYKVGTISKYEQGYRTPPFSIFFQLAKALDCQVSEFTDLSISEINEKSIQEDALDYFAKWLMYNHLGGNEITYLDGNEEKNGLLVNVDGRTYDIYEQNEEIQSILLENFKTLVKTIGTKL